MPPFLSVRHADDQTRSLTEGEKTRKQQRSAEDSGSGDWTVMGGLDQLIGGQRDPKGSMHL